MLFRPFLGEQRSGRLGGTIASHNRFGQYYRAGSIPVNPNTARQQAVRVAVGQLSIAWVNTLTQDQRDAWDLYGANVPWFNKLGQPVRLKGLAHYVRSNVPRIQGGLAAVDAAPVSFTLATAELALVGSASEATQQLSIAFADGSFWVSEDGAAQFIYMGAPQNPSVKFFNGPYRLLTVIEGDSTTPPTSPIAALDPPNFPFAEGQRIYLRSRISRADGRLSHFAHHDFLAAA